MSGDPRRRSRIGLLFVTVGAGLLLVAAGRPWLHVALDRPPPLPAASREVTGADVLAWLRPVALLGLAGVPALLATRRGGRLLVGLLLVAAGLVAAVRCTLLATGGAPALLARSGGAGRVAATDATAWPLLAAAGGLLLAAGAVGVLLSGRPDGLSARYEAPAAALAVPPPAALDPRGGEAAAWDALDRGDDPTREPSP